MLTSGHCDWWIPQYNSRIQGGAELSAGSLSYTICMSMTSRVVFLFPRKKVKLEYLKHAVQLGVFVGDWPILLLGPFYRLAPPKLSMLIYTKPYVKCTDIKHTRLWDVKYCREKSKEYVWHHCFLPWLTEITQQHRTWLQDQRHFLH